jgi:hypothetical protein
MAHVVLLSHVQVSQRGGTQNKTFYFRELPLLHFLLSDWPIKLACCRKQIEPRRHRIHLIGEVISKDETTFVAVYVSIGEVNSPDETISVTVYVCDIWSSFCMLNWWRKFHDLWRARSVRANLRTVCGWSNFHWSLVVELFPFTWDLPRWRTREKISYTFFPQRALGMGKYGFVWDLPHWLHTDIDHVVILACYVSEH